MKKILFLFVAALYVSFAAFAQAPESINYQAVARNTAGAALVNQTMKVRFTILRNAVAQYSETRQVTTNALGLFNVQIGSAGAITTTGTFNAIDWMNNTPNMALKVELDINNSNVFTDMGSQSFSSVPFALSAKKALTAENTDNIAGRPVDQVTTPETGSRLSWNGTSWTPVKKDTVYSVSYNGVGTILSSAAWRFLNSTIRIITVTGNERLVANLVSSVSYISTGINLFQVAVCYQLADGSGPITPITNTPTYFSAIPGTGSEPRITAVSGAGAFTLPAGNYIIGLAVRNNNETFVSTGSTNGYIEVKY